VQQRRGLLRRFGLRVHGLWRHGPLRPLARSLRRHSRAGLRLRRSDVLERLPAVAIARCSRGAGPLPRRRAPVRSRKRLRSSGRVLWSSGAAQRDVRTESRSVLGSSTDVPDGQRRQALARLQVAGRSATRLCRRMHCNRLGAPLRGSSPRRELQLTLNARGESSRAGRSGRVARGALGTCRRHGGCCKRFHAPPQKYG